MEANEKVSLANQAPYGVLFIDQKMTSEDMDHFPAPISCPSSQKGQDIKFSTALVRHLQAEIRRSR